MPMLTPKAKAKAAPKAKSEPTAKPEPKPEHEPEPEPGARCMYYVLSLAWLLKLIHPLPLLA